MTPNLLTAQAELTAAAIQRDANQAKCHQQQAHEQQATAITRKPATDLNDLQHKQNKDWENDRQHLVTKSGGLRLGGATPPGADAPIPLWSALLHGG